MNVTGLRKEFRVSAYRSGTWGALRGLVSGRDRVVRAIEDLSFRLERGEFVGYVGANGAGKSTTIKILVGILRATAGRVEVLGRDPHRYRREIALGLGVVFGQRTQLWWDLPATESFQLLGRIYRVPSSDFTRRHDELVDRLGLGGLLDVPVRKLSLGERMRCELVASLLHGPQLVILDEPTIGLDVAAKEEVRAFLRSLHAERGATVILTSHDLADIERLCSRVLVIDAGRLLHDGSLESLRRLFGHRRVLLAELREAGPSQPVAAPLPSAGAGGPFPGPGRAGIAESPTTDDPARDPLGALLPPGCELVEAGARRLRVEFDPDAITAPELVGLLLRHRDIADLQILERPIEDVVRRIYREAGAAKEPR